MASAQCNESFETRTYETRTPSLNSPDVRGSDTARSSIFSFRSSVSLIPTPGAVSKRHPTYEPFLSRFSFVTLGCVLLGALGIGLEVVLVISRHNGGFYVPQKNVFSFASIQFIISFIPSLLFVPLAIMFRTFDGSIRMWNPYLLLSRGHASADETLLLNYVGDSRTYNLYNSLKYKHRFVIMSGATALASLLFQPLAGAIFSVKQLSRSSATSVQSIRAIGLSPDVDDLTSFAASAVVICRSYSLLIKIGDPAFIDGGWAIAEFVFPTNVYLNGTMAINTTGIKITPNCELSKQVSVIPSPGGGGKGGGAESMINISVTSVEGCSSNIYPSPMDEGHGVWNASGLGCGTNALFFWFLDVTSNNMPVAVFCQPSMQFFDVTVFTSLNNNSLTNVTIIDKYPIANNVSGPPLNGVPHNGLIFPFYPDINVRDRADTIFYGFPSAIASQAEQAPGGLQSAFQNPNKFLGYTEQIYTRYLVLAAKSNYFIPQNQTANAVLTQLVPRLCVESLAAHILASTCMGVACVVLVLHYMHFRERRDIYLTHPPGSIGSALALTAHSGFGELLLPYDNVEEFSRALASFRFCLDRRTGAIVVDDSPIAYAGKRPASLVRPVRDEMMMTLIGKDGPVGIKASPGAESTRLVQSPD